MTSRATPSLDAATLHGALDAGALYCLGVTDGVFGIKVWVFGNTVYGQDTWLPQLAVGT